MMRHDFVIYASGIIVGAVTFHPETGLLSTLLATGFGLAMATIAAEYREQTRRRVRRGGKA